MAKLEWVVQEGHVWGRGDKPDEQAHAGESVWLTEEEAGSLAGRVLKLKEGVSLEGLSISALQGLIAEGMVTAQEVLDFELSQEKPRKTLISHLEEL